MTPRNIWKKDKKGLSRKRQQFEGIADVKDAFFHHIDTVAASAFERFKYRATKKHFEMFAGRTGAHTAK
jgi:hypothetical protein